MLRWTERGRPGAGEHRGACGEDGEKEGGKRKKGRHDSGFQAADSERTPATADGRDMGALLLRARSLVVRFCGAVTTGGGFLRGGRGYSGRTVAC